MFAVVLVGEGACEVLESFFLSYHHETTSFDDLLLHPWEYRFFSLEGCRKDAIKNMYAEGKDKKQDDEDIARQRMSEWKWIEIGWGCNSCGCLRLLSDEYCGHIWMCGRKEGRVRFIEIYQLSHEKYFDFFELS